MEESDILGAKPKALAAFLGIGISSEEQDEGSDVTASLLRAYLQGTLPLDRAVVNALPAIIGRLSQELVPMGEKPIVAVLLDRSIDLKSLMKIKDYGKRITQRVDIGAEDAVGVTIYYAAIASALLFHDKKITQHTFHSLTNSFELLAGRPWMPSDLREHFIQAHELCIRKMSEKQEQGA